jgi:hypothetical protein
MKRFRAVFLGTVLAAAVVAGPAAGAERKIPAKASGPASGADPLGLRVPDPQKELRHLSRDLKLKKDQRVGVGFILEERSREIQLLMDVESLTEEYREALAAKVIQDSDAQIANLLRSKQKRKFDKELARDREAL